MGIEARFVYFVMDSVKDANNEYIALCAFEGQSGYHQTDWHWGTDYAKARQCAEALNARRGIAQKDADKIIAGTMR